LAETTIVRGKTGHESDATESDLVLVSLLFHVVGDEFDADDGLHDVRRQHAVSPTCRYWRSVVVTTTLRSHRRLTTSQTCNNNRQVLFVQSKPD